MTTIPPCEVCDLENALRRGRATYVCPDCGRDISLEYLFWFEATHPDWDGATDPAFAKQIKPKE